jgi:oxygen-independent coproporphyrinogen-3 oxidase
MKQQLVFDFDLIRKYDQSGPRYTSYPTAVQFTTDFDENAYRDAAIASNDSDKALSLYFHIPFCDTVCFYCGCNKIATKDRSKAQPYLDRVYRELAMQTELFDKSRRVEQLHWGGGTPTFISHQQMTELMEQTRRHFSLAGDDTGEYSIEIDPREADSETVHLLRQLGFNRMSLGVQDFDDQVQKAVNRIQSEKETLEVLEAARKEGFRSISIDLIYGLPFQSASSFEKTLDRVITASPDRLSVFNYAHLPTMFKPQRRINEADLPSAQEKLDILTMSADRLADAGYVYIGMDHFAKPDDELAIAQREGSLYRNFQGYSTHADCDLIGLGVTSIGMIGPTYEQNLKTTEDYFEAIDNNRLAVFRGLTLTDDDLLRRDVITRLICNFSLDISAVEKQWNIRFSDYFANEQQALGELANDGLIEINETQIEVMPKGRFLIRNICMVFDIYMKKHQSGARFSKVI